MSVPTLPGWLHEGAPVAEVRDDRHGASVHRTRVERFTKTLVVLANGNRYRLRDYRTTDDCLERRTGEGFSSSTYRLHQPGDERVREAVRKIKVANARTHAHVTYENWRRSDATPTDVAEAFQTLAALENGAPE